MALTEFTITVCEEIDGSSSFEANHDLPIPAMGYFRVWTGEEIEFEGYRAVLLANTGCFSEFNGGTLRWEIKDTPGMLRISGTFNDGIED